MDEVSSVQGSIGMRTCIRVCDSLVDLYPVVVVAPVVAIWWRWRKSITESHIRLELTGKKRIVNRNQRVMDPPEILRTVCERYLAGCHC
jgi:hypothetical protein